MQQVGGQQIDGGATVVAVLIRNDQNSVLPMFLSCCVSGQSISLPEKNETNSAFSRFHATSSTSSVCMSNMMPTTSAATNSVFLTISILSTRSALLRTSRMSMLMSAKQNRAPMTQR